MGDAVGLIGLYFTLIGFMVVPQGTVVEPWS